MLAAWPWMQTGTWARKSKGGAAMRAIQIERFGGPEVLAEAEVPEPTPTAGKVLIDVTAAGINYVDTHRVADDYLSDQELPFIPGQEVVGKLEDGSRVVSLVRGGGYAERALGPLDLTFAVPDEITDMQALALMLQGATAWHLLRTSGHMKAGETVVVFAAAGGVGSIAVQLARAWRAGRVIAVASTREKRELCLSLGADAVVDSGRPDLAEALISANGGCGADVVLEMTGGDVFKAAMESLGHFGRLVHYGAASRTMAPPVEPRVLMSSCTAVAGFWLMLCTRAMLQESLDDLWAMTARKEIRPLIGEIYPLGDARRAHEDLRRRSTLGKLALDPAQ
jgi:NADPH:quinone reductase